jgi:hypothetical protein
MRRLVSVAAVLVAARARADATPTTTTPPPPTPLALPQAQSDARLLSADPDVPAMELAYRGHMRAAAGVRIPLFGDLAGTGFLLQLPALIELHNVDDEFIPYENWRGRLALEAIYRREASIGRTRAALAGAFALEHESDHTSVGGGEFVDLNSLSLRGEMTLPIGIHALTMGALARLHVLTCTTDPAMCASYSGLRGSQAPELVTDVIFDGVFVRNHPWRFFGALHAAWLIGNGYAATEARFVLDTGVAVRAQERGLFQLYFTMLVGNPVGLHRATSGVVEAGAGLRWGF